MPAVTPLVSCRDCPNVTDCPSGYCASHKPVTKVAESPTPPNPKKEQTVCITNHFKGSDKDCIDVPVSKVEAYLQKIKPNECCERTQPTEREPTRTYNRVYVDLDGVLPTNERAVFDAMVKDVRSILCGELIGNHSVMESCMFQCPDGDNLTNKLSWRVTYTHLHGEKDAIEQWVRTKFYNHLKKLLLTTIPVRLLEAGAKLKKDFKREDGSLEIDMSVYSRKGRKMRMLHQSKPGQKRPNKLAFGHAIDTLISYIPTDSVLISKKPVVDERIPVSNIIETAMDAINPEGSVTTDTTSSDPYHEPTEDEEATKELLKEVIGHLNQHRFDYYPLWLRLGFVLYNENFTVDEFIELSKRSKHYKESSSPSWIKSKWNHFRKSRLNQSTLWRWLAEDDPEEYHELVGRRKDFWQLMTCMSHAEVAQFFYNMKTDSYVYHEACGWYQLGNNNRWDLYEKVPSMLKSDIWNTLKKVAKEHLQAIPQPEDDNEEEAKQYKAKVKAIWKFVTAVGTSGFVDGVITFLPSMYKDEDLCEKMDEQRHLFAFQDKVLDLNTMEARDIEPTDYISINTGYPYPTKRNLEAREELIECLRSIFETNEEIESHPDSLGAMTQYALEHISTCLCGNNKYERFYIWTGKGGNGKGVLSEIVKRCLGQYYHPIPHTIITKMNDKKDSACPPLAKAKGKRFVQFSEPEAEDKFQVGIVKELTGGDQITARDLYKTTIIYKPQWSLYGQTNNIPKLNRADGGAGRRIRVIPFVFSFVADPTEPHQKAINLELKDKIVKNEGWRDEFILLLVEAYVRVKNIGLTEPEVVLEASKEYMEDNNPVGSWLRQYYVTGLDPNDSRYWISASELIEKYKEDTKHPISAERFKGGMILCDVEQKKVSHDFKSKVSGIDEITMEVTHKAGRYWIGIKPKE
jgi:P4 family phage/plasmid primase-like protien